MADYTRYKMETLLKMRERAFEKYYTEATKPCGNWGDGMRLSRLPSLSAYNNARERYEQICAEIGRRRVNA